VCMHLDAKQRGFPSKMKDWLKLVGEIGLDYIKILD